MRRNIDRFKSDLDALIDKGQMLEYSMTYAVDKDRFTKQVKQLLKDDKKEKEFLGSLPSFEKEYENWYSQSLSVLKQLLPDRVANFVSFYEKPKGRKKIIYGEYYIQDYLQGLSVTQPYTKETIVDRSAALPQFRQQLAILQAASQRFESSLFEIKQLLQSDLFDSEISAARELLKTGFVRAAGAVAGVVLERHLHQVCEDRKIPIKKKHPAIGDLNELLRSAEVIDILQWRFITLLADLRNLCCHNKKREPKADEVMELIDGCDKILKTVT